MSLLKALFMGLIQGITEFLPVSSSGHLALFKKILNIDLSSGIYFDILLHFGTLIAIIIVFREDIGGMIREFFNMLGTCFCNLLIFFKRKKGETRYKYIKVINSSYRKLVLMVVISTIPTGILGFLGRKLVEKASDTLWMVAIGFLISAVLLLLADRHRFGKINMKKAKYSDAVILGVVQGVATLPGISRSGSTISTGFMLGYNRKLAVKYSFIMSIPAVLGAVVVELAGEKNEAFGSANLPAYLLGTAVAAVVGYFSIKVMMKIIQKKRYFGFSIYCFICAFIAIVCFFIKG